MSARAAAGKVEYQREKGKTSAIVRTPVAKLQLADRPITIPASNKVGKDDGPRDGQAALSVPEPAVHCGPDQRKRRDKREHAGA